MFIPILIYVIFLLIYIVQTRASWAICYRRDLVIHGSDTNNYVEAQFLVLKDTICGNMLYLQYNVLVINLSKE